MTRGALSDEICPSCGYRTVTVSLEIPTCERCGWAGSVPVDQ